ncbi:MAG: hypothetical protein AAGA08_15740 [Pseudomonadota bacterium]
MMRLVSISLTVLFTTQVAAQDLSTSTALLTHFATRCGQIAADPTTAVSGISGASARIAGDRSLIVHKEPAGQNGEIAFTVTEFEGGKSSDCAMTLTRFIPGTYDDLGKLIAENAAALFGTEVIVTGSYADGDAVQMIATPGYPPSASLTHVQSRDTLEMVLSLNSAVAVPQPLPELAPQASATAPQPQPQVLDVTPTPQPVTLSPQELATGDDMIAGLAGCLNASTDPTTLAPAMLEAGFSFSGLAADGGLTFEKGTALAQLSPSDTKGLCTLIGTTASYGLASHVGEKAARLFVTAGTPAPEAVQVDGCPATRFTGPNGPVTLTYLNPSFRTTCDDPMGAAVRLSLQ